MPSTEEQHEDVESRFTYAPNLVTEIGDYHSEVRAEFRELAHYLVDYLPFSREKQTALTHLQTAMMFASAAIALNQEKVLDIMQEQADAHNGQG